MRIINMKKILYLISGLVLLAASTLAIASYLSLRDANAEITRLSSENTNLKQKLAKQDTAIKKFSGINKEDMFEACSKRAKENYTKYIDENSVSSTDGNVTTSVPKFPGMLEKASKTLETAEEQCKTAFSD